MYKFLAGDETIAKRDPLRIQNNFIEETDMALEEDVWRIHNQFLHLCILHEVQNSSDCP